MKKIALLFLISMILPVSALCPIDSGESVCALPDLNDSTQPIFEQNNNFGLNNNQQVTKQKLQYDSSIGNMNNPSKNMKYNSGCQFGTCLQDLNDKDNTK